MKNLRESVLQEDAEKRYCLLGTKSPNLGIGGLAENLRLGFHLYSSLLPRLIMLVTNNTENTDGRKVTLELPKFD
jgi:hypothetical protein